VDKRIREIATQEPRWTEHVYMEEVQMSANSDTAIQTETAKMKGNVMLGKSVGVR